VETPVIGILPGKIITEHLTFEIAPVDGDKRPDVARDLVKIAVVERHGVNGNRDGVREGVRAGARGDRVDRLPRPPQHRGGGGGCGDMAVAANRLGEIEGGFVVVEGGRVLAELALPVAGLMSLRSFEEVREGLVPCAPPRRGWG
jgi:adenine deaminase